MVPGRELTPRIDLHVVNILGLSFQWLRLGPEGHNDVVLAVVVIPELRAVAVVADAELDLVCERGHGQRYVEGEGVVDVVGSARGRGLGGDVVGLDVLTGSPVVDGVPSLHRLVEGEISNLGCLSQPRRDRGEEWEGECEPLRVKSEVTGQEKTTTKNYDTPCSR